MVRLARFGGAGPDRADMQAGDVEMRCNIQPLKAISLQVKGWTIVRECASVAGFERGRVRHSRELNAEYLVLSGNKRGLRVVEPTTWHRIALAHIVAHGGRWRISKSAAIVLFGISHG